MSTGSKSSSTETSSSSSSRIVCVIGQGFLGTKIVAELVMSGCIVTTVDTYVTNARARKGIVDAMCDVFSRSVREDEEKWSRLLKQFNLIPERDSVCSSSSSPSTISNSTESVPPGAPKPRNRKIPRTMTTSICEKAIHKLVQNVVEKRVIFHESIKDAVSNAHLVVEAVVERLDVKQAVLKEELTSTEITKIRRDLTVKPFTNTNYGNEAPPFPVYSESKRKLYLPRFYGIKEFGPPKSVKIDPGEDAPMNFTGKLKDKQLPIVKAFQDATLDRETGGGIISVPCGYGKTVLALYLAAQMGKKTLVIVHKEFLMNQWIERLKQFLPNAKVGIIQQNKVKVETIIETAMTSKKNLNSSLFKFVDS